MSWAEPGDPSDISEVVFELETIEDMVCLTVTHGEFGPESGMMKKLSGGWPRVLSSLKSYLEKGTGLNVRAGKSSCGSK